MASKRIYLDVCCLGRPTDDLDIVRNRLEAEAVIAIVAHARHGDWSLVNSAVIEYEVRRCSDPLRVRAARELLGVANAWIDIGQTEYDRARELSQLGLRDLDSLHLACAEAGKCSILLTIDDVFLKRSSRYRSRLRVSVENPVSWLLEQQL